MASGRELVLDRDDAGADELRGHRRLEPEGVPRLSAGTGSRNGGRPDGGDARSRHAGAVRPGTTAGAHGLSARGRFVESLAAQYESLWTGQAADRLLRVSARLEGRSDHERISTNLHPR